MVWHKQEFKTKPFLNLVSSNSLALVTAKWKIWNQKNLFWNLSAWMTWTLTRAATRTQWFLWLDNLYDRIVRCEHCLFAVLPTLRGLIAWGQRLPCLKLNSLSRTWHLYPSLPCCSWVWGYWLKTDTNIRFQPKRTLSLEFPTVVNSLRTCLLFHGIVSHHRHFYS